MTSNDDNPPAENDEIGSELNAAGARLRLAAGSSPPIDPAADLARRWQRRRRHSRRMLTSVAAVLLVSVASTLASGADGPNDTTSVRADAPPSAEGASDPAPRELKTDRTTTTSLESPAATTTTSTEPEAPSAPTTAPAGTTTEPGTTPSGSGVDDPAPTAPEPPPTTTNPTPPPTTIPPRAPATIVVTVIFHGEPFAGATAYVGGAKQVTGADGRAVIALPENYDIPDTYEVGAVWRDPDPYLGDPSGTNPAWWSNYEGCYQWWSSSQRVPVEDGASVTIDLKDFAWADCP